MELTNAILFVLLVLPNSCDLVVLVANNRTAFQASQVLLSYCNIASNVNSPLQYGGRPLEYSLTLQIDRFLNADDVTESFSLYGGVMASWQVPCVAQVAMNVDLWPPQLMVLQGEDSSDYWTPPIVHRNTVNDMSFKGNDRWTRNMMISPFAGSFLLAYFGRIESYCGMDLFVWPFDEQKCEIVISSFLLDIFAAIKNAASMFTNENYMPTNSNWDILDKQAFTERIGVPGVGNFTQAKFIFYIKRRPTYYLVNLFAPSLILASLAMTAFAIPADLPDRPAFACTVMLSLFVLQGQLQSMVPASPKTMVTTFYLMACILFAALVSKYSAIMCGFMNLREHQARKKVWFFGQQVSLFIAIDLSAAACFGSCLVLYNIITFIFLAYY